MDRNRHIDIMGIVNLTDDSFYSGSRCPDVRTAVDRIGSMLADGASIIDIGACSTRPGAVWQGAGQEWKRLEPLLRTMTDAYPGLRFSIDTCWSEVVRRSYDLAGNFIVNDISAGHADAEMLPLVGRLGLGYVAMHMRGTPQTMQKLTDYDDVVGDMLSYFKQFAESASKHGVDDWILDPGFGFAKNLSQNYEVLGRLRELKALGRPVLVGVSRKSMVYNLLGISPEESLAATQVLHYEALCNGADMLRVHDVKEACQTVGLYRKLFRLSD